MRTASLLFALHACLGLAQQPASPQDSVLTAARRLVDAKQPGQALDLLNRHLAMNPEDVDAELLRGLIYSWESRYPEGRKSLEAVLAQAPDYNDARIGLINLELWSGNPTRAITLASEGLQRVPKDPQYTAMLRKAVQQSRQQERVAKQTGPSGTAAESAAYSKPGWEFGVERSQIWFSDSRSTWNQTGYLLSKNTPWGYVTGDFIRATQGRSHDSLIELEMYPRIAKGTYGFISFGASQRFELFAKRRYGGEIFQSLPKGYEVSAGFRRFQFHDSVNLLTGSASKYFGNWWVSGRAFVTPGQTGLSRSIQFSARRYFGNADQFIGFRGGFGASPFEVRSINEAGLLHAETLGFEALWRFPNRLRLRATAGMTWQERQFTREQLKLYVAAVTLYYGL